MDRFGRIFRLVTTGYSLFTTRYDDRVPLARDRRRRPSRYGTDPGRDRPGRPGTEKEPGRSAAGLSREQPYGRGVGNSEYCCPHAEINSSPDPGPKRLNGMLQDRIADRALGPNGLRGRRQHVGEIDKDQVTGQICPADAVIALPLWPNVPRPLRKPIRIAARCHSTDPPVETPPTAALTNPAAGPATSPAAGPPRHPRRPAAAPASTVAAISTRWRPAQRRIVRGSAGTRLRSAFRFGDGSRPLSYFQLATARCRRIRYGTSSVLTRSRVVRPGR